MTLETAYDMQDAVHSWACPHCASSNITSDEFGSEYKRTKRVRCLWCKAVWRVTAQKRLWKPQAGTTFEWSLTTLKGPDPAVMEARRQRQVGSGWAMIRSLKSLCHHHMEAIDGGPKADKAEMLVQIRKLRGAALGLVEQADKMEQVLGS